MILWIQRGKTRLKTNHFIGKGKREIGAHPKGEGLGGGSKAGWVKQETREDYRTTTRKEKKSNQFPRPSTWVSRPLGVIFRREQKSKGDAAERGILGFEKKRSPSKLKPREYS